MNSLRPTGMLLNPRPPFSFSHTLRFILSPPALPKGRTFAPLLDHFEAGEYRRVADIDGQPVLYGVSEVSRSPGSLQVRVLAGPDDARTTATVRSLVERQFSAGLDLGAFERAAAADRVLSRLVARFRGMRIPQAVTVFETLISAILEQQINLAFAHQVKKALIDAYGETLEYAGRRYSAFPEAAALAVTTPRELRRLQISGPKARYIISLSQAVLDGALDLESLRAVEPAAAHERLLGWKGVGPWTAQYVGMRALGHLDCLPAADVGLQKVIQLFYGLRQRPSPARVDKLARGWAGWRSYATFYLWLTYWEEPAWRDGLVDQLRQERRRAAPRRARRARHTG
ncbi:MAG TPA: AlkA N-terminal domain-containing protein [Terriglobia bacterium]|nr:AlkA N-terminal domain-containing protein [Terriglobia bacterium]